MRHNKKSVIRRGRVSRKRPRLTFEQTAQLLVTLFAGIPMGIAFAIARWAGWGIDATIIAVMAGGILGAILLGAVVLGFSR